jgi:peptidylprolyl isomerase
VPRLRRALAPVVPALLIPALAACGSAQTGYGDKSVSGLDGVEVGGAFGKTPTLAWNAEIAYPSSTQVKTLIKGDGAAVGAADQVAATIYIADGSTASKNWNYDSAKAGSSQTENISAQTGPVFKQLLDGAHYGDRREALTSSEAIFGNAGQPSLGIGNHDALVVVVDVVKKFEAPKPTDVPAGKLPALLQHKGKPAGFDFKGVKKPDPNGKLYRSILKQGSGATVTPDMTVTANYLGMTYGAKKVFDESYSKQPASFALSQVVKGWTYGLTGVKVGSRVLLQIPPALGYGGQSQPASSKDHAGIPANSTLYFVVDIVSAKKS